MNDIRLPTQESMKKTITNYFGVRNKYDADLVKNLRIKPIDAANVQEWLHHPTFSMELTFARNFMISREMYARAPDLLDAQLSAAYFTILQKITEVARVHVLGYNETKTVPTLPFRVAVDPYLTYPGTIITHPSDYVRMIETIYTKLI